MHNELNLMRGLGAIDVFSALKKSVDVVETTAYTRR
tara:strand:+ start:148739 stop:148846 length:108 start_codon:yes stop_codon:yes gene_type:complete